VVRGSSVSAQPSTAMSCSKQAGINRLAPWALVPPISCRALHWALQTRSDNQLHVRTRCRLAADWLQDCADVSADRCMAAAQHTEDSTRSAQQPAVPAALTWVAASSTERRTGSSAAAPLPARTAAESSRH